MTVEQCEYNPDAKRAAYEHEQGHGEATVCVGRNGRWHLCAECAALPEFKRLKKKPLVRVEASTKPEHGTE